MKIASDCALWSFHGFSKMVKTSEIADIMSKMSTPGALGMKTMIDAKISLLIKKSNGCVTAELCSVLSFKPLNMVS